MNGLRVFFFSLAEEDKHTLSEYPPQGVQSDVARFKTRRPKRGDTLSDIVGHTKHAWQWVHSQKSYIILLKSLS